MIASSNIVHRRFDYPTVLLRPYNPEVPNVSPTPMVKHTSRRVFGKENSQPEHPPVVVRRTQPSASVWPPQVFYDPIMGNNFSNPLFDPYQGNPYAQFRPYYPPGSQHSKSPQEYESTFQGSFKPVNALFHRSPTYQAYEAHRSGAENHNGMGNRPSSSHSSNPLLAFASSSSRPGSSHEKHHNARDC